MASATTEIPMRVLVIISASVLALAAGPSLAQQPQDHSAHHPPSADTQPPPAKAAPASPAKPSDQTAMQEHCKAMMEQKGGGHADRAHGAPDAKAGSADHAAMCAEMMKKPEVEQKK
jgi:hypothetical protein